MVAEERIAAILLPETWKLWWSRGSAEHFIIFKQYPAHKQKRIKGDRPCELNEFKALPEI